MIIEITILFIIYSSVSILCAVNYHFDSPLLLKLLICFFFTPILGYMILKVIDIEKLNSMEITHFFCDKCGLEFTENENHCPLCLKDGTRTKLTPRKMRPL